MNFYVLDDAELKDETTTTSPNTTSTNIVLAPKDTPPTVVNAEHASASSTLSSLTFPPAPIEINFRQGFAGRCIMDLLQQAAKDKVCIENLNKRKETSKTFYEHMTESKRITAGVIFNAGHVNLSKSEIVDSVKEAFKSKNAEIMGKIVNELDRFHKRKMKATKIFLKVKKSHPQISCYSSINSSYLTMDDLKGLIMVLKRKSDSGMPKSVVDLKERWEKVRYRSELTYREHLTEQEYDENKVASVLLLHDPEAQPSTSTDCVASASA